MIVRIFRTAIWVLLITASAANSNNIQHFYKDLPFIQDFSQKIPLSAELTETKLSVVRCDRNGRILVLSNKGLLQVYNGQLVPDKTYRPLTDMQIKSVETYRGQFIYLTDKAVLSNAWAGRLLIGHKMPDAELFMPGSDFDFLLAGKTSIVYFNQGKQVEEWQTGRNEAKQILFDGAHNRFLLLFDNKLVGWANSVFAHAVKSPRVQRVPKVRVAHSTTFEGNNLNCMGFTKDDTVLIIGTEDGYIELDAESLKPQSDLQKKLPCTYIRCIRQIGESVWFGTPQGAFALDGEGKTNYYASKRWLVDDNVTDISKGPENSVLILTDSGLNIIHFEPMTLEQKAEHFDKLTRQRHIRNGLSCSLSMSKPGDLSTGTLVDSDNDGLWTSMYLAGELFRYAVTKSDDVLQNCYESFDAMERLSQINRIEGFPSRSFERAGYHLSDRSRWRPAEDPNWTWKATTSSDEIVGHFFVYSIFAEVVPDKEWRDRAITLIDDIMAHIVRNDLYLIDYDGKPTLWGRWNPDYVNKFPRQVGDRRLNSIEIIAFLQTAYHFTGREIYRDKAFELLNKYGYLDNIMIPISQVGRVPGIDLTTEWNHSDDELAFLSYWNLYKYAFTDELRKKYLQTIKGHWQIERPEKNPLWNLIYVMTGAADFDLDQTIWTLKEFPLDMISWSVRNSQRKDLEFPEPGFRNQTTRNVLPPDERPMSKYNGNAFRLDGGDGGHSEYSGDIYLLPYWLGRYLKIIR